MNISCGRRIAYQNIPPLSRGRPLRESVRGLPKQHLLAGGLARASQLTESKNGFSYMSSRSFVTKSEMSSNFKVSTPATSSVLISYPSPHVLLVTLNRAKVLNAIDIATAYELEALFKWYDATPQLRCAVLTGAGRAFCAGADLKEWNEINERHAAGTPEERPRIPPSGFAGLGRRRGKKPIIGAVNGLALGGGFEIVTAMDLVVAARSATFGLPEAKRGVGALTGVLPRLMKMVGRQRALEIALTGRSLSAEEMERWGIVNAIVEDGTPEEAAFDKPVVRRALQYADQIVNNSPDSVIVMRDAAMSAWYQGDVDAANDEALDKWLKKLEDGENIREGVRAFVEKRIPKWRNSML